MVAYTKPQQRKKEESERLRGEEIRSSLLVIDLKFPTVVLVSGDCSFYEFFILRCDFSS